MAPHTKEDHLIKSNLRCYFKRSINKFKSPISKVANALKSTFGLKTVRLLASNSWDFLNSSLMQNEEENVDDEYVDIYTKLLLKLQTCKAIKQNDYFIQVEKKDSARYWAGYLWDFKLISAAEDNKTLDEYFNKCMARTILRMDTQDLITVKKMMKGYCKDNFTDVNDDINPSNLTFYLLEQIMIKDYREILIGLVNMWFLKSPLLHEIAKHVTWNFVNDINACLLSVNDLYEIYINQCYKNWQK